MTSLFIDPVTTFVVGAILFFLLKAHVTKLVSEVKNDIVTIDRSIRSHVVSEVDSLEQSVKQHLTTGITDVKDSVTTATDKLHTSTDNLKAHAQLVMDTTAQRENQTTIPRVICPICTRTVYKFQKRADGTVLGCIDCLNR